MQHYRIPHTDLSVSRIAYGTWHLGGSWDTTPPSAEVKQHARALIEAAVEHGINHIDLADIYTLGKSDEVVGLALKAHPGLRDKLVLQEKAGIILAADPNFGPPGRYDFSYDHLVRAVEGSLKRLGTDYLDLLALHRPDALIEPEEVARAFDYLQRQGMVRYFGVSNHSAAQIALLKRYLDQPLVVNQLELSLVHHHLISSGILVNMATGDDAKVSGLLDYCRLNDIMVQAWSPLAGGAFLKPEVPEPLKPLATAVARLAEAKGVSPTAIALAWLLRHPAGIQPIIGTKTPARIADAVAADSVVLSRAEWYGLLEAARGAGVP